MHRINKDYIIWILTMLMFSSFTILESSGSGPVMIALAIIIFLVDVRSNRFKFYWNGFFTWISLFSIYCGLTALWAADARSSVEVAISLFRILIALLLVYPYYYRQKSNDKIIDAIMWGGYIVALYACLFYGPGFLINLLLSGGVLTNGFANVNTMAITIAVSIVLSVNRFFERKKVDFILLVLDLISVAIIAASGSRKSLVLVVIGIVAICMVKSASKNMINSILKWIPIGVFLIVIIRWGLSLPMFDAINQRMDGLLALVTQKGEIDHSSWLRQQYIEIGMQQFRRTPLLGMGMDNTHLLTFVVEGRSTYLHNNYVELLAGGGIVALLLFYSIYIFIGIRLWKGRKMKESKTLVCLVWVALLLMIQYGAVVYYYKDTFFCIMVFFLQTQVIKRPVMKKSKLK